jgi:hypothetical protein
MKHHMNVTTTTARASTTTTRQGAAPLRMKWMDGPRWDELYRQAQVRQPPHALPPSPRHLRRYLTKIGVSVAQFCGSMGISSLRRFHEMNPSVPLFAAIGMTLEFKEAGDYRT